MRFLVDECTGPAVARWLRDLGHDVYSVYDQSRGADDSTVMQIAAAERRILVTNDKDFGEKIYREKAEHHGVVLLRIQDQRVINKITALGQLLDRYSQRLEGSFVVVTEKQVRFAKHNV